MMMVRWLLRLHFMSRNGIVNHHSKSCSSYQSSKAFKIFRRKNHFERKKRKESDSDIESLAQELMGQPQWENSTTLHLDEVV